MEMSRAMIYETVLLSAHIDKEDQGEERNQEQE